MSLSDSGVIDFWDRLLITAMFGLMLVALFLGAYRDDDRG